MTVAESFAAMPGMINTNSIAGLDKTFQWNITGEQAGVYALKLANGAAEVIPGGVEKPNVTFTVSDKDWISIIEGKLDPTSAFMGGKLKVTGDMMLAMRVASFIRRQ